MSAGKANRLSRWWVAALVLGGGLVGADAPAAAPQTIHFSFRGYANNVKVLPPLVGPWQLGVARINGSGTVGGPNNIIQGETADANQPHDVRYAPSSMRAKVDGYSYYRAAHGAYTNLTLTIEITTTDAPRCEAGDRGTLTLHRSAARLRNRQRSDYVLMRWDSARCPEFVQGWSNLNGGARTSPRYGGPPRGGQWAIVRISP